MLSNLKLFNIEYFLVMSLSHASYLFQEIHPFKRLHLKVPCSADVCSNLIILSFICLGQFEKV